MQNSRFLQSGLTLAAALALISGANSAFAGGFKAGDLVVSQVGDGSAALSSSSTAVFLDDYSTSGAAGTSINLTTSGTNPFTESGVATSEGALALSSDGKYLTISGYDTGTGTASVAKSASSAVPREEAVIGGSGSVNTSTTTAQFSGNNPRGVATLGGTNPTLYAGGASGGIYSIPEGSTGSNQNQVESATANIRNVAIFNTGTSNALYFSTGSGIAGIYEAGTFATDGTYTALSGGPKLIAQDGTTTTSGGKTTTANNSPYGFYFNNGNLYVADSGIGLQEYNATTGSLIATDTITNGLYGLTGNGSALYATTGFAGTASSGNSLVSLTGGFTGNESNADTTLATAGTNEAFRGVAFAPNGGPASPAPEPGQVSILLMSAGGLGLAFLRRRKQMSLQATAA